SRPRARRQACRQLQGGAHEGVAGFGGGVHPSWVYPQARHRRRERLALPVPRLALRHVGAHPEGSGAEEPRRSALRLPKRERNPDRLRTLMQHESTYKPTNAFTRWLDARLPVLRFVQDTLLDYPTPKNLNYWWTFGGVLAFCLVTQIVTGIVL